MFVISSGLARLAFAALSLSADRHAASLTPRLAHQRERRGGGGGKGPSSSHLPWELTLRRVAIECEQAFGCRERIASRKVKVSLIFPGPGSIFHEGVA